MCYNGYQKKKKSFYHCNHLPISPEHLAIPINDISDDVKDLIKICNKQDVSISRISQMIEGKYGIFVSLNSLYKYKDQCIYDMVEKSGVNAQITWQQTSAADKLIAYFNAKTNISYIYILHNIDSGFVTNKRNNKNSMVSSESTAENIVGVPMSDIKS